MKNIGAADGIAAILAGTTGYRYRIRSKLAKTLAKKLKFTKKICKFCVYTTIRNFCYYIETYIHHLFLKEKFL